MNITLLKLYLLVLALSEGESNIFTKSRKELLKNFFINIFSDILDKNKSLILIQVLTSHLIEEEIVTLAFENIIRGLTLLDEELFNITKLK